MDILILGGTRFFGKEFLNLCAAKGHKITVFSRRKAALPPSAKYIKGDRADLSILKNKKWDFVLDNICFTAKDMLEALNTFSGNTAHYVFVSTGDVHLAVVGAKSPFTENMAHKLPRKTTKVDAYGKGKYEAEKLLTQSSLPYTIVRFPIVIGPEDPKERLFTYLLRIWDGKPVILPDGGKYKRRFIYLNDAAQALYKVMKNRNKCLGKVFQFGDEALTLKKFIGLCFELCGKKNNTLSVPSVWLEKHGYDLAKSNPYFNKGDYVLSVTAAKRVLGWKHTPTKKWLKKVITYYKDNKTALPVPESYNSRKQEVKLMEEYK